MTVRPEYGVHTVHLHSVQVTSVSCCTQIFTHFFMAYRQLEIIFRQPIWSCVAKEVAIPRQQLDERRPYQWSLIGCR